VSLRILVANLWNGRADPRAFGELVAQRQLDAVAVQELSPEQARELERVLPHGKLEPARDYSGMGIALRYPAPIRRLPLPGRDAWIASLEPGDWTRLERPVELLNVHIFSPLCKAIRSTFAGRRSQLQGLERYLNEAPRVPRALLGDLNSTPLWPLYRRLVSHLEDAAVRAARSQGTRPRPTWGPSARSPRLLRIDHVLVDGLAARSLEVVPIVGSDHSGVACELIPAGLEGE
jgi:endonuclease/exonuclease/phosphatase family metal-dependent hydrolase